MNIQLPVEEGYFNITPVTFCDLESYLITPEIDAKWNDKNLHFRSLIVSKEGNVLSSGFKKFFNKGEKIDCYPDPKRFNDWVLYEKIDGSCLICDYVNGQFSMRTRGTFSYKQQENYKDFELLLEKYPKILDFLKENSHYSLLFEIVTPNNVIVIRPKDVDFYFIGAVDKRTLEMATNFELLEIWNETGYSLLPERYYFDSKPNLQSLSNLVKTWKGKEGIVLVYNNGQNRIKLKSDWYCSLHKIKSQLSSTNNLVEYYVQKRMPCYDDFYKKIETDFDFEIAEQLKDQLLKISQTGEDVKQEIENMKEFCNSIRNFENRKKQAEHIMKSYSSSQKTAYVFSLLDGKELSEIQLIKFIHKKIENS
jgi:hypothetical protein